MKKENSRKKLQNMVWKVKSGEKKDKKGNRKIFQHSADYDPPTTRGAREAGGWREGGVPAEGWAPC
jgi:hypothetical protein